MEEDKYISSTVKLSPVICMSKIILWFFFEGEVVDDFWGDNMFLEQRICIISIQMIKNSKVVRMLHENSLEQDNYTLVLRLKRIIEQLKLKIREQDETISGLKKNGKNTKISEMQIEIQHLNDENKRLILMLQEMRSKSKHKEITPMKKILANQQKYEHRRPNLTEMKCEGRINDVLKQNQHLRRELLNFRVNESFYKKRTSNAKDRNSIFIEKNIIELQKLQQKKMDLEEENVSLGNKIKQL